MIPTMALEEWYHEKPWQDLAKVEQDLLICRCIVAIYQDDFLASQLAFRGGTAMHKLYYHPQPRYSEDIDLVQIYPGLIKPILQRLGQVLAFMPDKVVKQKRHSNSMLFRIDSESLPVVQLRLKVEINCCEHFTLLGHVKRPFAVENTWFSGECMVTTYQLEEMLATKLRALYQRRKGRDLFDMYYALTHPPLDLAKLLECYHRHIAATGDQPPSYQQFINNMDTKILLPDYRENTMPMLRPGLDFDPNAAYELVREKLLERLPGRR